MGSFNLLGRTAPVQATSLLIVGPFLDYWLTDKRVVAYDYTLPSMVISLCQSLFHPWVYMSWYSYMSNMILVSTYICVIWFFLRSCSCKWKLGEYFFTNKLMSMIFCRHSYSFPAQSLWERTWASSYALGGSRQSRSRWLAIWRRSSYWSLGSSSLVRKAWTCRLS